MTIRTTSDVPAAEVAGAPGVPPYGLNRAEQDAEMARLARAGWQEWELQLRFPAGSFGEEAAE
ncbi:hypothetical protein ACFVVA_28955 [Kitasatospora sp. NPDC058048]|uniref:hypothetical protein n=1 Tax=Kitasatospora sp. NPDC058048 TaxID=3346313 RepID=UPI0036DF7A62